jgi:mannose-6-phosphate isomerase
VAAFEKVYKTPAPDFELTALQLKAGAGGTVNTASATILLVTQGAVTVTEAATTLTINAGQAFLATANSQFLLQASADAVLYRAAVPLV